MFFESVRMTEGFDPLKEGCSRSEGVTSRVRYAISHQAGCAPDIIVSPVLLVRAECPSHLALAPHVQPCASLCALWGNDLLHPDWLLGCSLMTQCFLPVPRLLLCLFAMGVAGSPQTTGEVWLRSSLLWRTFFESFIWQNGKNSWSGNSSEDTDSHTNVVDRLSNLVWLSLSVRWLSKGCEFPRPRDSLLKKALSVCVLL